MQCTCVCQGLEGTGITVAYLAFRTGGGGGAI